MSLLVRQNRNAIASLARRRWSNGMHAAAVLPSNIYGGALSNDDNDNNNSNSNTSRQLGGLPQIRSYHTSAPNDRAVAIMLGLGTIAAVSFSAAQGVKAYNEWKDSLPEEPTEEEKEAQAKAEDQKEQTEKQQKQAGGDASQQKKKADAGSKGGKRENIFKQWFGVGVGAKYYEGGFEDTMTRREAALILGVRESSPPSRIKDAHRKLLILNHPDTGGSTYIAGKINEAKELLLKGRRQRP